MSRTLLRAASGVTPPGPSVLSYVGSRSGQTYATSLSLAQPAGAAAGDVGVIFVDNGGTMTPPSGYVSPTGASGGFLYKVYGAGEGPAVITVSSANNIFAVLGVFRNPYASAPFDAASNRSAGSSGSSVSPSNAITATHISFLISGVSWYSAGGTPTLTPPPGFTMVNSTLSGGYNVAMAYQPGYVASQSSGTPSWSGTVQNTYSLHNLAFLRQVGT